MKYLKNNPQRKNLGNKFTKFIAKINKVRTHHELYLKFFINFLKLNEKPLNVLEIGGGDGWAIEYNSKKITKTMIDRDDEYKKTLEEKNIKFIKGTLGTDEFKLNDEFDIIIMNHVIEHIFNYEKATKEIYKMLKKGGYIIIRCPNILKNKHNFWNDFTHVKPYTKNSLEKMFKTFNFTTIHLSSFKYRNFIIGHLVNSKIQKFISFNFGGNILYIGKK